MRILYPVRHGQISNQSRNHENHQSEQNKQQNHRKNMRASLSSQSSLPDQRRFFPTGRHFGTLVLMNTYLPLLGFLFGQTLFQAHPQQKRKYTKTDQNEKLTHGYTTSILTGTKI